MQLGVELVNSGEWISKYVKKKHWIKLHTAVDIQTHKFIVTKITKENVADTKEFTALVKEAIKIGKISKVLADAAYDSEKNFRLLEEFGVEPGIRLRLIERVDG